MPSECLFCRIVAGDDPAEIVAREDGIVAFRDIFPRAPVHILVVPEEHLDSAHDLTDQHADLLSRMFRVAREVATAEGTQHGYRIVTNIGSEGGQAIPHLHLHVLGGRQLGHIDSMAPPTS